MDKREIQDMILHEEGYAESMETVVLPYLAARMSDKYCEREEGKRIFYVCALSDKPHGIVVISHGYTETVEKHLETIYYFLRAGYHVFMPEHCGHGRSYRMCSDAKDLSLVYVEDYMRYVEDFLFISRMASKEFPQLPLCLFGHSMGGGIGLAAAAHEPNLFARLVLSSPMIRPLTAPVPWGLACLIAGTCCIMGKSERYVMGQQPYAGLEKFDDSASVSKARFDYYQKKRNENPLFQMSAASYGWLWQTARLNLYLRTKAWQKIDCPVIVFQAEHDTFVSKSEQDRFVQKLCRRKEAEARFARVPGVKHEIFNSDVKTLEDYWEMVLG